MCIQQKAVPESMHTAIIDKNPSSMMYRGGFADVFRAEHRGRPVAVKSIRISAGSNLEMVASVNVSLFVSK
jgi:hypothetical protein